MNGVVYHGNNESRRLIEEHEFYYPADGDNDDSDDGQGSADPGGRLVVKHTRVVMCRYVECCRDASCTSEMHFRTQPIAIRSIRVPHSDAASYFRSLSSSFLRRGLSGTNSMFLSRLGRSLWETSVTAILWEVSLGIV